MPNPDLNFSANRSEKLVDSADNPSAVLKKLNLVATQWANLSSDLFKKLWVQHTTGFDFGIEQAKHNLNQSHQQKETFQFICRVLEQPDYNFPVQLFSIITS